MKILYARKMIKNENEKNNIPLSMYEEKDIKKEVLKILQKNEAFRQPNIFGNKSLGYPLEYEKLVIIDDEGEKTFEYYNKGIHFMTQHSENARQIFQVFAFFMMKNE